MIDRIYDYMIRNRMIEEGGCILAAVSGGADSMCLLEILRELRIRAGFHLRVLHVHHGLRESAEGDLEYVAGYCANAGIPFEAVRVDAAGYAAEAGMSVEEAARHLRYDKQREIAAVRKRGVPKQREIAAVRKCGVPKQREIAAVRKHGVPKQRESAAIRLRGALGQRELAAIQLCTMQDRSRSSPGGPGGDRTVQSCARQQVKGSSRDASGEREDHQAAS